MVILHFKMSDIGRVCLDVDGSAPLDSLVRRVKGAPSDSLIAIRKGSVMRMNDHVQDGEEVDLFPALAGG